MSIYSIVLFFHVVGAIGYCLGIGMLLFILVDLRRAQRVEHVQALIHLNDRSAPFSAASAIVLLITGLYMTLTEWSLLTSWILVALVSLILMVPISAVLIAPRRIAMSKQLTREAPDGVVSEDLKRRIDDPVLAVVVQAVATLLLGLIFLMITKPGLLASIIVVAVALLLGVTASLLALRMRRSPQPGMIAR